MSIPAHPAVPHPMDSLSPSSSSSWLGAEELFPWKTKGFRMLQTQDLLPAEFSSSLANTSLRQENASLQVPAAATPQHPHPALLFPPGFPLLAFSFLFLTPALSCARQALVPQNSGQGEPQIHARSRILNLLLAPELALLLTQV